LFCDDLNLAADILINYYSMFQFLIGNKYKTWY